MRKLSSIRLFSIAIILLCATIAIAQPDEGTRQAWNRPVKPFRVIANIYYVGAEGVASYLITTPQGHILMDSGFAETVPRIQDSVNQLGFKLEDVKVLINSHAHYDHAGGFAELKKLTGAKLMIGEGDAKLISDGENQKGSVCKGPAQVERGDPLATANGSVC